MDTVEDVTLGKEDPTVSGADDFTKAMNSYNNAISRLNKRAEAYLDTKEYASEARCVGSVPDDKDSQSGYFTSSYAYMSSYNGKLRDADTNYQTDYNKMKDLGIENIGKNYWLASRNVRSDSTSSAFRVRSVYGKRQHQLHRLVLRR